MKKPKKVFLFLIAALSACSESGGSEIVLRELPEELSQSFEICLAAMDGIDQAISVASDRGWSVNDHRIDEQYGVPQSHGQTATASRKYPGESQSDGRGQSITFGVSIYPLGKEFYCNELKFRNNDLEDYNLFYDKISGLDSIDGEAKIYDDCPRKRCEGRVSGHWNFTHNGGLVWLTSNLDDSIFNLTFRKFEINNR